MTQFLKTFRTDETGAVTIDWVVLTALVVALATAAFAGINGGTTEATAAIRDYLMSLL